MKWYLTIKWRAVNDILDFKNEEDLTLFIWQMQDAFPDMQMEIFFGVEA